MNRSVRHSAGRRCSPGVQLGGSDTNPHPKRHLPAQKAGPPPRGLQVPRPRPGARRRNHHRSAPQCTRGRRNGRPRPEGDLRGLLSGGGAERQPPPPLSARHRAGGGDSLSRRSNEPMSARVPAAGPGAHRPPAPHAPAPPPSTKWRRAAGCRPPQGSAETPFPRPPGAQSAANPGEGPGGTGPLRGGARATPGPRRPSRPRQRPNRSRPPLRPPGRGVCTAGLSSRPGSSPPGDVRPLPSLPGRASRAPGPPLRPAPQPAASSAPILALCGRLRPPSRVSLLPPAPPSTPPAPPPPALCPPWRLCTWW